MPPATLARRFEILLRRFEKLGDVGRGIGIHPQHLGRRRGLQLSRLRSYEGCGNRGDVHTLTRDSACGRLHRDHEPVMVSIWVPSDIVRMLFLVSR